MHIRISWRPWRSWRFLILSVMVILPGFDQHEEIPFDCSHALVVAEVAGKPIVNWLLENRSAHGEALANRLLSGGPQRSLHRLQRCSFAQQYHAAALGITVRDDAADRRPFRLTCWGFDLPPIG